LCGDFWFNVSVDVLSGCPGWPRGRGPRCAIGASFRTAANATLAWSLDPAQLRLTRDGELLRRVSLDAIPGLGAGSAAGPVVKTLSVLRRGTYWLLYLNGKYASWAPHPFHSWCANSLDGYAPGLLTQGRRAAPWQLDPPCGPLRPRSLMILTYTPTSPSLHLRIHAI
jgi:hypothetical protein